jgi:ABC-type dipeptide/oligopeptide/nickel transport system ATPase component
MSGVSSHASTLPEIGTNAIKAPELTLTSGSAFNFTMPLEKLKVKLDLAMLFITHDLHVAAQICDRIAVMRYGEILEMQPTAALLSNPNDQYTGDLLAAIPGHGLKPTMR